MSDHPIASAQARALNAKRNALQKLTNAGDDPEKRGAALVELGEAEEAMRKTIEAARLKGIDLRKEKKPSKKDREIERLQARIYVLEEAARLIEAGVELAEAEDSLEDWIDEARDWLEGVGAVEL